MVINFMTVLSNCILLIALVKQKEKERAKSELITQGMQIRFDI